jgi:hypothetical protein
LGESGTQENRKLQKVYGWKTGVPVGEDEQAARWAAVFLMINFFS